MSSASYPVIGSGSGGGVPIYANFASFPAGTAAGSLAVAADTGDLYEWNGAAWQQIAGPNAALSVGAFGSTPNANGLSLTSGVLVMQPADGTHPGGVSIAAQTMAGAKTFSTAPILSSLSASLPLQLDASKNITAAAIDLSGTQATGILAAARFPALTGDITTVAGALGTTLATVNSNVGSFTNAAITVNGKGLVTAAASGTTGNLTEATSSVLTIGSGTGAVLGSGTTIQVKQASTSVSGYLSNTDWNTFNNKQASLTLGDLSDVGTDGIVVTGGTGAVVGTGTSIAQHVADTTHNGYLTSTDWNTFNGKQATVSFATIGSSPAAGGASISGGTITLQPSDGSNGGVITTSAQTIPGQKTFASTPIMSALSTTQLVATDSSKQLISVSYGPTPAASRVLQRDANGNGNARAGNFCQDTVSVATAGTTTTLTIASVGYQRFTGSLNQTCKLPSGTTLTAGWQFTIQNVSSGTITVQDGNAGTIATMAANSLYQFVITDVSTTAGAWDIHNLTAGLSNPMTTGGDIIYGGSSGTPTRLANGTSAQYLQSAGGTSAPTWQSFKVPTIQTFTSTGSTVGWLFTISTSSTVAVSDTYTNNGHTYTVIAALTAQTGAVFWASGASAPTASGTLTRSAGAGTSSISFTSAVAYGTYTAPSPAPLYVRVRGVGGGGGGGGSGTADGTAATDGTGSYFGANLIFGTGGLHGVRLTGGVGGTAGLTTAGPIGSSFAGADGGHGVFSNTSPTSGVLGGSGGQTPFGGAGFGGGGGEAGGAAKTNTGSGGGGGGGGATTNVQGGGAGAAGGFFDYIITSPSATYPYIIGTAGSAGGAGTNGFVGGAGAAGYLEITELYQ